jgi:FKBP-type peptidyl-prolyl cis-trans isomerase FkpA
MPPMKASVAALALIALAAGAIPARAAESAPTVDRLRLGVRDLPATAAWLEKVLGWKPSFRDDRRALFVSGSAKLELDAAQDDAPAAIALASADADADFARWLERGAVSVSTPTDRPSGFREASVRGPGALIFELEGPLAAPPEFEFAEIAPGAGEPPRPGETVKVRYVGALKDGTIFDGSHKTGRPALVPLGSAIRCWTEAFGRMRPGGRAHFVCPPSTAYGAKGRPPRIPPNATLVFDVELVDVLR